MKYLKFYIIFELLISLNFMLVAQNYIITSTPTDIVTSLTPSRNGNENCITTIQYYNGLGYPSQAVQVGITPQKRNLYTFTDYIGIDLVCKNYLPVYSSTNEELPPASYKKQTDATYNKDSRPYTETISESIDPHRPLSVRSPGEAWQGHPTIFSYGTNAKNEVRKYTLSQKGQIIVSYYPANTLHKTTTKDPDGHQIDTYTDLTGKTIMTKTANSNNFCTYYVYDELQRLRYVFPPMLKITSSVNAPDGNYDIYLYAYEYKYDNRGNVIYKKLPGAEPIYMVYDQTNKLVLMQDGNMRAISAIKWIYTAYDEYNRIIYSYEIHINNKTNAQLHNFYDTLTVCEKVNNKRNGFFYTYNCLPPSSSIMKFYREYFYDDYAFIDFYGPYMSSNLKKAFAFESVAMGHLYARGESIGKLTGELIYDLGDLGYITKAYYYDNKENIIQRKQFSHLGYNNYEYEFHYTQYNFSGTPRRVGTVVATGSLQRVLAEEYDYTYDHANRLTAVNYSCGQTLENRIQLYTNYYDELGFLTRQNFYNDMAQATYQYDIHDNPTQIKNIAFTQDIHYIDNCFTPCYNGNVSAVSCSNDLSFNYSYDSHNRLYQSRTQKNNGSPYSERFYYEENGNVINVERYNGRGVLVDGLDIQYNGNQVVRVDEYGTNQNAKQTKEYQNYSNAPEQFLYDVNGNLIKDKDRKISKISYNELNLPKKITFTNGNMIENYYTADGMRWQSIIYTVKPSVATLSGMSGVASSFNMVTRFYRGNREYANDWNTLVRLHNPLGYITLSSDNKTITGWYHYAKDYLGNVREVYRVNPNDSKAQCLIKYNSIMGGKRPSATMLQQRCCTLVQRMNYYPSGLPLDNCTNSDEQPYKYTGKEYVEEHGLDEYDNGARWYYPALARTTTMDPHCEKYYDQSPYSWCGNNFVNAVDIDGKDWYEKDEGYWDINLTSPSCGQYIHNKSIEWTDATSQLELGDKGRYLGANVLVGTHNRDENLYEAPNTAQFDLYFSTNKEGPVATIMGNTVPADVNTMGTMPEGLYPAEYRVYHNKPAILINGGRPIPTVRGGSAKNPLNHIGNDINNPMKPVSEHVMDGVYFHYGNNFSTSLRCNNNTDRYWSTGCQTGGNYKGSHADYLKFIQNVPTTFKGSYYLRGK